MDYKKIYINLIEIGNHRTLDGYFELHHIIPKCMGGNNSTNNLVKLTPEEHYVAHQLLVKMYPNNTKLIYAASCMIPNRKSNKMYGWLRRRYSKIRSNEQSGKGNSQFGTRWVTNGAIELKIKGEISDGFSYGRLSSFIAKQTRNIEIQNRLDEKRNNLYPFYIIYINEGFDAVKLAGYKYSKQNLVTLFSKYIPEFIPQNGKPR